MQITVRYQSIDGVNQRKTFATIPKLRAYVDKMIGADAEYGRAGMYAVSSDGIGKVTLVEVMNNDTGRRLDCLAAVMVEPVPGTEPKPEPTEQEIYEAAEKAEADAEAAMWAEAYPPEPPIFRAAGCTCSDMQLAKVGCDCWAEKGPF